LRVLQNFWGEKMVRSKRFSDFGTHESALTLEKRIETSVIMAALIGTLLLGERPWERRVTAAVLVAGGVALITGFS
jgi:hypothetical protein